MELLIFYIVLVHELSPLTKYVIHQAVLWLPAKTPKPDTSWENRHDDDVIMHLCALGDPLGRGGKGGEGDSQDHTLCQVA